MTFADFGPVRKDSSELTASAQIVPFNEYVTIHPSLMAGLQKYINHRIYDFWDNSTRFELYNSSIEGGSLLILRMNGSCEGLSKKIPALTIRAMVQPADNYFNQESQVLQQKTFRIHSRHLITESDDGYCVFGIAGFDTS